MAAKVTELPCLILGGCRSGKSRLAQGIAAARGGDQVLFVATAQSSDPEMARRIARHQRDRPATWLTAEAPLNLLAPLQRHSHLPVVLIDCLSLWVANHLLHRDPPDIAELEAKLSEHLQQLLAVAAEQQQALILVSNEVGLGVVPPYPLGRHYRDLLGWINQQAAHHCPTVLWTVAGIPTPIKAPNLPPQRFP
ncbi:MAG: bifunctional adenosylcobinamide kinase/adenosylcobinamide-phosphate guanylyltransferase [Thermostichales cyanobacterium GMQP_bins_62]